MNPRRRRINRQNRKWLFFTINRPEGPSKIRVRRGGPSHAFLVKMRAVSA